MVGHTELQMPGIVPRQNSWLPFIHRLSMPVGQRPPSGGVGIPRDQADGVECSEAPCGCDIAGYSIGLLPTRYVEEPLSTTCLAASCSVTSMSPGNGSRLSRRSL